MTNKPNQNKGAAQITQITVGSHDSHGQEVLHIPQSSYAQYWWR